MKFYKETHSANEIKGMLIWSRTQHYEASLPLLEGALWDS